ncbi:XrtA/PEP-CTERM system TPR-repeat protein PrsT [Thalassotalea montiporae]
MNKVSISAIAIAVALSLTACSEHKTAEQYVAAAEKLAASNKFDTAIIELKNAIKMEPKNAAVRLSLGKLYLKIGNYVSAEKELERAQSLGIDFSELSGELSQLYSRQSNTKKLYAFLEQGVSLEDEQYLTILFYAAIAAYNNNELERASDLLAQASVFDSKYDVVKLAKAYQHYAQGEYELGLEEASLVSDESGFYFEAMLAKGHLLFADKKFLEASEAFKVVHQKAPVDNQFLLFLINSLWSDENFSDAETYIDRYLARQPNSAIALYYRARSEFQKKNYAFAQEFAEKSLQSSENMIMARSVAGLSAFHLEKYEQAFAHLSMLEPHLAENSPLSSITNFVKIKLGYFTEEDGLQLTKEEAQQLVSDSYGLARAGLIAEVEKILSDEEVVSKSPAEQMSQLGLLKAGIDKEASFDLLIKAVELDSSSEQARIALASAYYNADELQKGIEFAKQWIVDFPTSITAVNMLAKLLIKNKQINEADQVLSESLKLDSKNLYAHQYFIGKHINTGEYEQAGIQLNRLLVEFPDHIGLLGLFFKMELAQKDTTQALELISKAYQRQSTNHVVKLFYASVLFMNKSFEQAEKVLRTWEVNRVEPPRRYYVLLVGSLTSIERYSDALEVSQQWIEKYPVDSMAWVNHLSILENSRNTAGTVAAVKEMLTVLPHRPKLAVFLPYYQLLNKEFQAAKKSLSELDTSLFPAVFIEGMKAEVMFSEGNYEEALPKLEAYYKYRPNFRRAGFIYTSLFKLGRIEESLSFIESHLKVFPRDTVTTAFYAEYLLSRNEAKARMLYQSLVSEFPSNFVFLNNLAWLEYRLNNFDKALKYAEKANDLAPNKAIILDTLAMIYFKKGNLQLAKTSSAKAKKLAPNNKEIRSHFELINKG